MTDILLLVARLAVILGGLLFLAAVLIYAERKLLGRLQIRFGPNRAGPFGILQPIADIVKLLTKEDTVPEHASRVIFLLAPAVVAAGAFLIFAAVPFGDAVTLFGRRIPLGVADMPTGMLYILALYSLSVYGVVLGGWASGSKFSMIGGMRSAAQLISYELGLGMSLVPVVLLSGSYDLRAIVEAQRSCPFIVMLPVSFVLFFFCALAEAKRLPYDLPEAESELVAGYHVEYSGMRFGLFFLGEYATLVVIGSLIAIFFLGGWHGPLLPGFVWFLLKVSAWFRGTLPRLRYDQLLQLGWKAVLPAALVNIIICSAIRLLAG